MKDISKIALMECSPMPKTLRLAAEEVAQSFGLGADWLNPGPTELLVHGLPEGFVERLTGRDYVPALRVWFAARVDQVFLKLYAAVDRREERDFSDLRQLEPTDEELRAGAR